MRKLIATALSTTLLVGTVSTAAFAEEAAINSAETFEGNRSEVEFVITSPDGEVLNGYFLAEENEAGDVSMSGGVVLPASLVEAEEDVTIAADDVIRIVSGDLYLNVDTVIGLYQELTGDASLVSLKTMVGIDQPWLVVPKLDIPELEAAAEESLVDDDLQNAILECMSAFEIEQTETGCIVSFDGDGLVSFIRSYEDVIGNYTDNLMAVMTGNLGDVEIDYKTVFADYITAAAEGINAADPNISVEDGVVLINSLIDEMIVQAQSEIDTAMEVLESTENTEGETVEAEEVSIADELAAAIANGVVINGQITVDVLEDSMSVLTSVDVTEDEENVNVSVSVICYNDSEYAEVSAPESATALRDVVKNAVTLFYSMTMTEPESTTTAE